MALLAIFIALVFLHSLISGRLERTIMTAPIVFTAAGMLALLFLPALHSIARATSKRFSAWPRRAWCCCSLPTPAAPTWAC